MRVIAGCWSSFPPSRVGELGHSHFGLDQDANELSILSTFTRDHICVCGRSLAITFCWIMQWVFGKLDGCAYTFITTALQYLHVQGASKERNNNFLLAMTFML